MRRPTSISKWLPGFLISCALFLGTLEIHAQASKEYQVKAVFLFRLAQFVTWPANAFETETSPIIIGVLGEDPFGEALDLAVRGETAHNRPLEVKRFRRAEDAKSCHLLFVSRSESARVKEITAAVAGQTILTVSDSEDFAQKYNGIVRFKTDQNKVTLRIDPEAAKAANLVLDTRLLRIAEIVGKR